MYPFTEGSFAVKNGWYVAAFTHELGRELLPRTILNEPVVLYRKEDGTAVAVGGRCPHRHFPLGASCLKNDTIVCGYHGIAFDADGQCVNIPSQTHTPKTYRIPTYPLVEHGIWAWIWMGDPEKADPALLPDLTEIGAEGEGIHLKPMYVEHVNGRYQLLNDNLLDLSHIAVLHGTSIGTMDNASVPEEYERRPGYVGSKRVMRNVSAPEVYRAVGVDVETIDRTSGMSFYLPGFHAGIDESTYPAGHPREGEYIAWSRIFHGITPETYHTAHYFFALAGTDPQAVAFMEDYLKPVVGEDKFATEEIEKMLRIIGENPNELLIKSDRNAVEGRRALQAMIDAERDLDAPVPQASLHDKDMASLD
ncbi:MAG: Rieske 2Fe-2S domain-containing protein [Novosphingobium sp.]|nr:Rieske 2Fe-2S domain-containing protein [Novosphingobium sp.]